MSDATTRPVWCFLGAPLAERRSTHPSAIFSSVEAAERWIAEHALSGLLTLYHLDVPAFERSLALGTVPVAQRDGSLRQVWAGGEAHHHYEDGRRVG
ncbi:MAG: hypothetical protein HEQ23_09855 [Tepidisphaera sp.]